MPSPGNHESELGNGPIGYQAYQTYFSVPPTSGQTDVTHGLWYAFTAGAVRVISIANDDVTYQDAGNSYIRETFRAEFLRKLARRGLRGVKLVISDAHEGLKAAITKVLYATWQRCRVHFMRNLLAHAGPSGRRVAAAFIGTAFVQEDATAARIQWRRVIHQLKPSLPKLAAFILQAEDDVMAYMTFPAATAQSYTQPIPSSG